MAGEHVGWVLVEVDLVAHQQHEVRLGFLDELGEGFPGSLSFGRCAGDHAEGKVRHRRQVGMVRNEPVPSRHAHDRRAERSSDRSSLDRSPAATAIAVLNSITPASVLTNGNVPAPEIRKE